MQGAILRVKLRHLEQLDRGAPRRARRATTRCSQDSGVDAAGARCRTRGTSTTSTRSARATATGCSSSCSRAGIQTGLHYPIPVHLQQAHADLGYGAGDFPQSEAAASEVLSLPMYPEMPLTDVERTAAAIAEVASSATVRASS